MKSYSSDISWVHTSDSPPCFLLFAQGSFPNQDFELFAFQVSPLSEFSEFWTISPTVSYCTQKALVQTTFFFKVGINAQEKNPTMEIDPCKQLSLLTKEQFHSQNFEIFQNKDLLIIFFSSDSKFAPKFSIISLNMKAISLKFCRLMHSTQAHLFHYWPKGSFLVRISISWSY